MLSLAKLEGLTELVSASEFDLIPTLNRLAQERSPIITAKQIQLQLPEQRHFECYGDRVLISQAVVNLLDNAIGFCAPNANISITIDKTDTQYNIRVFNEGDAIPEFALKKLYERFFSLPRPHHDTNIQSTKSTGLGLSFVKEIMKLHKGSIHISNTDSGVIAHLVWPI